jgi:hypothetical protein
MARAVSTDWFADHLQNELTPGTVVLLRAWLAEACRINGSYFSATSLAESLAAYVVITMDEDDLGQAPRDTAMPTVEQMAAAAAMAPSYKTNFSC